MDEKSIPYTPTMSSCALCKAGHDEDRKLQRCGGCGLRFYCSVACQKDHWKDHKKECKQAQEIKKSLSASVDAALDTTHPFERLIDSFIRTTEFSAESVVALVDEIDSEFFLGPDGMCNSDIMSMLTENGYHRLNLLMIRGLREFTDDNDVVEHCLMVIGNYLNVFVSVRSGGPMNTFKLDVLIRAGLLDTTIACLRIHGNKPYSQALFFCWRIMTKVTMSDHARTIERLVQEGIVELATICLRLHGKQVDLCIQILNALCTLCVNANMKDVPLWPVLDKGLVLAIIIVLKLFPRENKIQKYGCNVLRWVVQLTKETDDAMWYDAYEDEEETEEPEEHLAELVKLGVFDVAIAAMRNFSSDQSILQSAVHIASTTSDLYYGEEGGANKETALNTLLACCTDKTMDDEGFCQLITVCFLHIVSTSPEFALQFVYPGHGLQTITSILEKYYRSNGSIVEATSELIAYIFDSAEKWDQESPARLALKLALESKLRFLMNQCARQYKNKQGVGKPPQLGAIMDALTLTANFLDGVDEDTIAAVRDLIQAQGSWEYGQTEARQLFQRFGVKV